MMTRVFMVACAALLVWPAAVFAQAPSVDAIATASGTNPTATFGVAPTSANVIICFVGIASQTETVTMSGLDEIANIAHPSSQGANENVRVYAFWRVGDGTTTGFQAVISGSAGAAMVCASLDDADTEDPVHVFGTGATYPGGTSHSLSGGLTTTIEDTLILAFIRSSTVASYTNGSGYSDLETNGTLVAAHGIQREAADADTYAVSWSSAASEDAVFVAVAIAPTGGEPPPSVRCCGGPMRGVLP